MANGISAEFIANFKTLPETSQCNTVKRAAAVLEVPSYIVESQAVTGDGQTCVCSDTDRCTSAVSVALAKLNTYYTAGSMLMILSDFPTASEVQAILTAGYLYKVHYINGTEDAELKQKLEDNNITITKLINSKLRSMATMAEPEELPEFTMELQENGDAKFFNPDGSWHHTIGNYAAFMKASQNGGKL